MSQAGLVPLFTVQNKSQPQIRSDMLRTLANALRGLGIPQPNVGEGSDYYGTADGLANELAVVQSNGVVNTNNQMPDTAAASFLDRWLALFKLSRKAATNSFGVILPAYSIAQGYTLIPVDSQLQDSSGNLFTVTAGGSYGPGNPPSQPPNLYVPVSSLEGGAGNDHANGDTLQWISSIAYVGPQATVGTADGEDGLSGGNDSEIGQDEPPRARLFAKIQNPPSAGNWSDVAGWARDSSPDVQDCGVYPALQGGGNMFFSVWGAPQTQGVLSATSKTRSLPAALIAGTVVPYVQGLYPTRAIVVGASVVDSPNDVALLLSLPSAPTASPAGPGGGWLDGTPWPSSIGGTAACLVTGVSTTLQFTVNAVDPPQKGVSRIAYISPSNWQLYTATVVDYSGISGAWVVTLDQPWPLLGIDFGASPRVAIFPQSAQQANYLTAVFAGFAALGAGEWSSSGIVLARAFRHPPPTLQWPSSLDATFLRTVENAGQEVKSAQFIYRQQSGAPPVPAGPTITVDEPFSLTSQGPNIYVPRMLAWYAK